MSTFEDRLKLALAPSSQSYHSLVAVVQQRDIADALALIAALRAELARVRVPA